MKPLKIKCLRKGNYVGIISMRFGSAFELLIRIFAFARYKRKISCAMGQYISDSRSPAKPIIEMEGNYFTIVSKCPWCPQNQP
jgi:hypothetical protein